MQIESTIRETELPAHVHATILTGRDVVSGSQLAYPVVWADRPYDTCSGCRQPVDVVVACPVMLDTGAGQGGAIREWSQQHGCGQWLRIDWRQVTRSDGDVTEADILTVAAELAADRQQQIATARQKIAADLEADLRRALARLAEPLDDDETAQDRAYDVTTGSDVDPGVCLDGDQWLAWAYPPVQDGGDDPVLVHASDLAARADDADDADADGM